jgi:cobalt-zinc-cadmium efflux system membrane fusion protein
MKYTTYYSILFLLAAFLSSCKVHNTVSEKKQQVVTDSLLKTLPTAPAVMDDITEVIKLNGKITPNESKQAKVYALVSGRITSAPVEPGDYVKKGQVLAILQSAEVAGISNDLTLAQSNADIARKSLESAEELYKSSLATSRELTVAKLDYNKALSELNRSRQVNAINGGTEATYVLKAPQDGYVIEKNITPNSEVRQDNNTSLFTIADLSSVWILANVYEADINSIHLGDEVTVTTLTDPSRTYSGKIDKLYNVLDPLSRTMKVRISMNNPGNELKPEMFAMVNVKGKPAGRMLSIPSHAVVLNNSKQYVIVKNGDQLIIQPIQVLKRIGDKSFITGLAENEQVVTSSEVFLFEALNSK